MGNKSKQGGDRSTATIDLGKVRKERIEDFRAKRRMARKPIATQEDAVNTLVDIALEKEGIKL
jgi:hypothetical protein